MRFVITGIMDKPKLWIRSGFHYLSYRYIQEPFFIRTRGRVGMVYSGGLAGSNWLYKRVVIDDEYRIFEYAKSNTPRVIVDIGANIGLFSKLCSLLFPQTDIYAYEPNPRVLPILSKNAENTRIKVEPYAISDKCGAIQFDPDYGDASALAKIELTGQLTVKTIDYSKVAESLTIDLLKMDCEGSEWAILKDTKFLGRVNNLCMEYHCTTLHTTQELCELVKRGGHRIVCVQQNHLWSTKI